MSDNWIALIPDDPDYIPTDSAQKEATRIFLEIALESEEVRSQIFPDYHFHDCGANLERITCPHCGESIEIDFWQQIMSQDSVGDHFQLNGYSFPCCHKSSTLHELEYSFSQGFGKYRLESMNPNLEELAPEQIKEFEETLKTKLRIIYQHI